MSFNISYIFQAIDKFSSPVSAINRSMETMKNKTEQLAKSLEKAKSKLAKMGEGMGNLGNKLKSTGKSLSLSVTAPFLAMSALAIKSAGDIEALTLSLEGLLKSSTKAHALMKDLQKFRENTPFSMEDVTNSSRRLLGAGFKANEIMPMLNMTGDIAAGSGNSLESINMVFSKIKSKGRATAQDLMQMQELGIPILQTLARGFNMTEAQVLKMAQKGRVKFKAMYAAARKLTSEGGVYYKQLEKQSKTINGLASTLKNKVSSSLTLIGHQFIKAFGGTEGMEKLIKVFDKLNTKMADFFEKHPNWTKWLIRIATVLALIPPVLIALGAALIVGGKGWLAMKVAIIGVGLALKGLFLNPVGLAIGLIAALALGFVYLYKKSDKFRKLISDIGRHAKQEFQKVLDMINWVIDKVDELLSKVGNFFKSRAPAVDAMPTGADRVKSLLSNPITGTSNKNQAPTRMEINVNDKNNFIKSITTQQGGFGEMIMHRNGRNMPGAG